MKNRQITDTILSMIELTSKQRKVLEKYAHPLEPIVIVGSNGVTDQVVDKVLKSIECHELLKVKFNDFKDEKVELTQKICNQTDSCLVKIIGNVAILYKQNKDPSKRKYKI